MTQIDSQGVDLFCPDCGYSLRQLTSDRCPECGTPIDRTTIGQSVIPWTHREQLGRIRAFIRTRWLTTLKPRTLAREMAIPISLSDAQRFRWGVVIVVSLPFVAAAIVARLLLKDFDPTAMATLPALSTAPQPNLAWMELAACVVTGFWLWPVGPVAIVLFFAGVSGVQSYFFHPSGIPIERQNRAVALSYYACGPLAWLPIPTFLAAAIISLQVYSEEWFQAAQWMAAMLWFFTIGLLLVPILLMWWLNTIRLLHHSIQCTTTRMLATAAGLPVLWIILAGLCFGLFPAICGFFAMVYLSYSGSG